MDKGMSANFFFLFSLIRKNSILVVFHSKRILLICLPTSKGVIDVSASSNAVSRLHSYR